MKFRPRFELRTQFAGLRGSAHEKCDESRVQDARRFPLKPCFEGYVDVDFITFLLAHHVLGKRALDGAKLLTHLAKDLTS
jgi:hypothetical protein